MDSMLQAQIFQYDTQGLFVLFIQKLTVDVMLHITCLLALGDLDEELCVRHYMLPFMSQSSKVSEVTGYGLDDWNLIPDKGNNFSFCHHVQSGSGAHPVFSPRGTGVSSPRSKVAEA
jgi:hypothetical protein